MKITLEIPDQDKDNILEYCQHYKHFNPKQMTIAEVSKMAQLMKFLKRNPCFSEETIELYKKNPGLYAGASVKFEIEDTEKMQSCFNATAPVFQQLEEQLNK